MRRLGISVAFAALTTLLLAPGCTTISSQSAQYERNGVRYGVTKGTFRGRWWNYYERGRSFSDGAFWSEAESDLRTALASRSRDQLWSRTYGLHFLPEYFPHRELGIVFFHQERFDEAAAELETSLAQQYSARAAYFLNEARREQIAKIANDREPPTITLQFSEETGVIDSLEIVPKGVVEDDTYVSRLTIDGRDVPLQVSAPRIEFPGPLVTDSFHVTLAPGRNVVEVEAEDLSGKVTQRQIILTTDVDGPAVSFNAPVVVPGTIRGVALDPSGVKALTINGQNAALQRTAREQVAFEVKVTSAKPDSPLQYECTDEKGNVTRGRVPVNGLVLSKTIPAVMPASNGVSVERLGPGLAGLNVNGVLVAVAADARHAAEPEIRFPNLRDGQQYLMDEVIVGLDVAAPNPIAEARINDVDLNLAPDRSLQHLSRRLRLVPGPNVIHADVRDAQGKTSKASLTVERKFTDLEQRVNHLNAAILGFVAEGNAPRVDDEPDFIRDELIGQLSRQNRFQFVDRRLLPDVIAEQQLSAALSSKEGRLALGRVIPAEIFLTGRIHRDADSIEIVVEAISTETALFVARSDVAGRADTPDELEGLVRDLALRIVQEFPRVQGEVARVRGEPPSQRVRPTVAIPASQWDTAGVLTADELTWVIDEFERELQQANRFNFVSRDRLDTIQRETRLSETLGPEEKRLALGRILPADVLLEVQFQRVAGNVTAVGASIDTRTMEATIRHTVSQAASDEDGFRNLGRYLARELLPLLPTEGRYDDAGRSAPRITATLTSKQGVSESMKYVVFRYGPEILDPITKEVIGQETEIVGEGLVQSVNDSSSVAEMLSTNAALPVPVRAGDYVATK